ncbi:hypothetical protein A7Q01_06145 [Eikenella sp. NML96-A-049]|nr:hypothetical protein A7P97_03490 [Eikenella sp. NML070372]OAM39030.1 hypothetical protein A7Q01_06145 [Eikenella sp. NML96-A-049]
MMLKRQDEMRWVLVRQPVQTEWVQPQSVIRLNQPSMGLLSVMVHMQKLRAVIPPRSVPVPKLWEMLQ